jgi:hypothetical protein
LLDRLEKIFLLILFFSFHLTIQSQEIFNIHSSRDKSNLLAVIRLDSKYFVFFQDSTFFDKRIKCKVFSKNNPKEQKEFYLTPRLSTFQDELKFSVVSNRLIFLSFVDFRDDGEGDVYSQLIDENGILWDSSGIPVCTEKGKQKNISVTVDNSKNIFLVWQDFRSDSDGDIYVQKLDLFGNPLWKKNGIVVTNLIGSEIKPDIASDESGGCYVSYIENILQVQKLYVQRIDSSGKKSFGQYGIFVSNPEENCIDQKIITDFKSEPLIFYTSKGQQNKIYFQRLSKKGAKKFSLFGKELSSMKGNQELLDVIRFSSNDLAVLFLIEEKENSSIAYLQILSQNEKPKFKNPIKIHSECNFHQKPEMHLDDKGFFIYWTCHHNERNKVSLFIQTITPKGEILKAEGLRINSDELEPISKFYLNLDHPVECVASNYQGKNNIVFLLFDLNEYKNPKIENFTATYHDGHIKIRWDLINERPNTKIYLDRKTSDNDNWERIFDYQSKEKSAFNQMSFDDQILDSENLKYRIIGIDPDGNQISNEEIEVETDPVPEGFYLYQNSPNPFSQSTKIAFKVPIKTKVVIKLYNSRLEEVGTILNDTFDPGTYEFEFVPFGSMESGIYFYRIFASNFYDVKKMIYSK